MLKAASGTPSPRSAEARFHRGKLDGYVTGWVACDREIAGTHRGADTFRARVLADRAIIANQSSLALISGSHRIQFGKFHQQPFKFLKVRSPVHRFLLRS